LAGLIWGIIVILFVVWLVGGVISHFSYGLLHILLVIALVLLVFNIITGRGAKI